MFDAYRSHGRDDGLTPSMGLGLAVSSTLAHLMGGDLSYHRDQGRSVFRLVVAAARNTVSVA